MMRKFGRKPVQFPPERYLGRIASETPGMFASGFGRAYALEYTSQRRQLSMTIAMTLTVFQYNQHDREWDTYYTQALEYFLAQSGGYIRLILSLKYSKPLQLTRKRQVYN